MNYLLLSIIIVIFLKVIFKQKYEVKDLVFIVYYYAIMTMFHNKSVYQMILPVLSAFLIYSYIKKKYIFIKHSLFPAIVIQYLICFSIDQLPIQFITTNYILQTTISFGVFILCLILVGKTTILQNNEIDDFKSILMIYMFISEIFVSYLINVLKNGYAKSLIVVIELFFFLSTIVFFLIIDRIIRHNKEKRMIEIENVELKNIQQQYAISKHKKEYVLKIKHDLNYLKQLLENNGSTEVACQIDRINKTIGQLDEKVYTDNIVVNSFINQTKQIAQQYNLKIQFNINAPLSKMDLTIKHYDFLLELIMYVCSKNSKDLSLNILKIDQTFIVEIISPNKSLEIMQNNNLIISNKDNGLSIKYLIE